MMSFPRNSAFDQGAGIVPASSREDPQELAETIPCRTHVTVPISQYEAWIAALEEVVDASRDPDLEDVIHDMRSRFRG
jgi:hypothetical protein